jgi:hypothetical protein
MIEYLGGIISGVLGLVLVQRRRRKPAAAVATVRKKRPRDEYLKIREAVERRYLDTMASYDKLIPWASGGALLLSITVSDAAVRCPYVLARWVLGLSWLVLGVSLLCSIVSHFTSAKAFLARIRLLDHEQIESGEADQTEWQVRCGALDADRNRWDRTTRVLNPLSGGLLAAGLMLLAAFVYLNPPCPRQP